MITNQLRVALTAAANSVPPAELASLATDKDSVKEVKVVLPESFAEALLPQREKGDEVNGFLLCVLISKAAKRIIIRAENIGVLLPVSTVMRSVMCAYQLAAKDASSPFTESKPDIVRLMKLDEKILSNALERQARDTVKR